MMRLFSQIVILCVIFNAIVGDKTRVVETKQGKVEGSLSSSGLYYEFLGIRYGVPVKFRAPKEPPSYSGIYKADNRVVICPQFPTNDPLAAPSDNEDCLILNVFSPNNENSSLPVMVYLHGGDFGIGSSSPVFYNPQYLLTQNVIVVTVNYRLNVYGFLNLGIEEAPGNAGLKDIREALRWVKKNIKQFNGDPDNVTVFGQGSGGVAAIYLTLSESTVGLFHKIISQSGSLFTPEAFDVDGLATASQVAKSLELITTDPYKLLKLYSETEIDVVEEAISKQMNAKSVFLPTVENEFENEEAFLTDTPYNILALGKKHGCFNPVPAIIGTNTVEGIGKTLDYFTTTSQMDRIKHDDFSALDQKSFSVPSDEIEEFRNIIKDTYFADTSSDETVVGGLINMNSDFSFVGPISLFSEMYSNSSNYPLYEYVFNYMGNRNLGRLLTNTSLPATANRDELFYVFELERIPLPMDEDDARMITFMTSMWTNFAKHGSPTPDSEYGEWLPFPHNLAITLEPQYVAPLTPDRAYFWRALYYKFGADILKPLKRNERKNFKSRISKIKEKQRSEANINSDLSSEIVPHKTLIEEQQNYSAPDSSSSTEESNIMLTQAKIYHPQDKTKKYFKERSESKNDKHNSSVKNEESESEEDKFEIFNSNIKKSISTVSRLEESQEYDDFDTETYNENLPQSSNDDYSYE